MNSETLFSMALGLQPPWQVKEVTFSTDELARSELHLHIDFASGSRFPDETNELSLKILECATGTQADAIRK